LELIKSCDLSTSHNMGYESARARPGARRSSSSTMSSSSQLLATSSPITSTPQLLRSATSKSHFESNGSKYEAPRSSRLTSTAAMTPAALRPVSRDGSGSSSSPSTKSRLPRTSQGAKFSRLSLASQRREQNQTEIPNPNRQQNSAVSRPGGRLAQARQRRMTSGGPGS
jgi:hypothetical protein